VQVRRSIRFLFNVTTKSASVFNLRAKLYNLVRASDTTLEELQMSRSRTLVLQSRVNTRDNGFRDARLEVEDVLHEYDYPTNERSADRFPSALGLTEADFVDMASTRPPVGAMNHPFIDLLNSLRREEIARMFSFNKEFTASLPKDGTAGQFRYALYATMTNNGASETAMDLDDLKMFVADVRDTLSLPENEYAHTQASVMGSACGGNARDNRASPSGSRRAVEPYVYNAQAVASAAAHTEHRTRTPVSTGNSTTDAHRGRDHA
jgi:hypothetical protein